MYDIPNVIYAHQKQRRWKKIKLSKYHSVQFIYNHDHNIMKTFDVLPNVPFTTSETKPEY